MKKAFACLLTVFLLALAACASAATIYQTESELVSYLQTCANRNESSITFTVGQSLFDKLSKGGYYSDVFSSAGLSNWNGSTRSDGTYTLTNVRYSSNFRYCQTLPELSSYISECAEKKLVSFAVYCPELNEANYDSTLKEYMLQNGISNWRTSYSGHRYEFFEVEVDMNFCYCADRQALETYLYHCAANGWTSFSFYLPASTRNDYELVIVPCMRTAGICSWSSSYIGNLRSVTDAVYFNHFKQCGTLNEVKEYVRVCSEKQLSDFAFTYPAGADSQMKHFFDLLENYGYWQGSAHHVEDDRLIYLENIIYRPGWNIVRALVNNTQEYLSDSESRTLSIAQSVVRDAASSCSTAFQYAKYFHDYLITHVTYQLAPEGRVNDTAVGALAYGIAECDGYADSFYLLCSLAGIDVAYQHGDADDPNNDEVHLWNSLKLNGTWHFVDVTWDDSDCSTCNELFSYRYFNIGSNYMPEHQFYADLCPVPVSGYTDWDYFVYTAPETSGIETGVYTNDPGYFIQKWYKEGRRIIHLMIDGKKSGDALDEYLYNSISSTKLNGVKWTYYNYEFDDYTLIDLYIQPN